MTDVKIPLRAAIGLAAVAALSVTALVLTFPSSHLLGMMFESDGQIETATEFFRDWNRRNSVDYDSRLHTADLLLMTVHREQAVVELAAMVRDWPNDSVVLERLINVENSLLMVDESLPYLERLAELKPRDPSVLRRLADHYRWKGSSEKLLATLLKLTFLENVGDERAELIDSLLSNRRYDDLIKWIGAKIDTAPDPVDLRLALYEAYVRTGRVDDAAEQLRHVLELSPDRIEFLRPVGVYLLRRGLLDQAVALYRDRIDRHPREAMQLEAELTELYESRTETLVRGGQLKDAVKIYRQRITLAPTNVRLYLELAELYGTRATDVAITT
jgi:tetratricopeptide (TPR) repeat protein